MKKQILCIIAIIFMLLFVTACGKTANNNSIQDSIPENSDSELNTDNAESVSRLVKVKESETERLEFTYDEQGNLIKQDSYMFGEYDHSFNYAYEYDDQNRLTKKITYEEGIDEDNYDAYEYDEQGNLIKEITNVSSNKMLSSYEAWIFYEYNPDGTIAKKTYYSPVLDSYHSYYLYEYNSEGLVLKETKYTLDEDTNAYELAGWEEYTYDEQGNKLTETHFLDDGYEMDSTIFTYDEYGRLIKESDGFYECIYSY